MARNQEEGTSSDTRKRGRTQAAVEGQRLQSRRSVVLQTGQKAR